VANKRTILTETDVLAIVESTEAELLAAARILDATSKHVLDGAFEPGAFDQLVKAGTLKASTILDKDNQPAYVIIHTRNPLGWLMVEGAVKVGTGTLDLLFEGGYALARHLGASHVQFVTKLKALYEYARENGFTTLGVLLCKPVPQ
jgi:hypothetical protein